MDTDQADLELHCFSNADIKNLEINMCVFLVLLFVFFSYLSQYILENRQQISKLLLTCKRRVSLQFKDSAIVKSIETHSNCIIMIRFWGIIIRICQRYDVSLNDNRVTGNNERRNPRSKYNHNNSTLTKDIMRVMS